MQGQDIRVYETDSTRGDIAVYRTDYTEGDTKGVGRKKPCWPKKKFWIQATSLIALLFITLTLGISLYFGLFYGKHESKGNYFNHFIESLKILLLIL